MVFSSYQDGEPDIDFRQIGDQKLVLAVPKDHPLAMYDSVDLKDTVDYPQIYFQKGSGLRPVIDQMYEQISVFPKIAFEIEEDGSMAGLVAQGFGIAVMPDIPILKTLDVKTLTITNPEYERHVYLATMKNAISPRSQNPSSSSLCRRQSSESHNIHSLKRVLRRLTAIPSMIHPPHKLDKPLYRRQLIFPAHISHIHSM